jgi:hypothetical protein
LELVIRPLFILPFCYFAGRRNLTGVATNYLGDDHQHRWFPAPETMPRLEVVEYLEVEKRWLSDGSAYPWSLAQVFRDSV